MSDDKPYVHRHLDPTRGGAPRAMCPRCQGVGTTGRDPVTCTLCDGTGRYATTKTKGDP